MFLGEYQHTLDAKGRVSLPAKFRSQMTGTVVVSKGMDRCLYITTVEEYQRANAKLFDKEDFDPRVRELRRKFVAGADTLDIDSAGRVSLPAKLRDYAGLERDVVVTGNGNRIEVWNAASWQSYSEVGESMEDLAKELADSGWL